MTLVVPTVEDVRTQQALNVIAEQFPLQGQQYANESVEGKHIVSETITGNLIVNGTITGTKIAAGTIEAGLLAAESVETKHLKAEAVTAAKIKAETIEAGQIKANAITAAKINAEAVEAGKIKAEAVTTTKLAANAVTAAKIEAHTITATQIAASTITSTEIASATITGSNIASATITASKISITELSALSGDLGTIKAGTITGATVRTAASGKRVVLDGEGLRAYNASEATVLNFSISTGNLSIKGKVEEGSEVPAAVVTGQLTNAQLKEIEAAKITGTIVEGQIAAEAVGAGKIKAEAVTAAKVAAEAIEAGKIKAGAVTTAKLAAEAITAEKIAAATITATQIATDAIESKHVKAEAIESGDIKAGTILASNIAASTITGAKIASETITATNIAASTITAAKLNVSELSAIAANLGSVTAGTINGVNIILPESEAEAPAEVNTIEWKAGATVGAEIYGYLSGTKSAVAALSSNRSKARENGLLLLRATDSAGNLSTFTIKAEKAAAEILASVKGISRTIIDDSERSGFLQLTATAKLKIAHGTTTIEYPGGSPASNLTTVTHGLGTTPAQVFLCCNGSAALTLGYTEAGSTTFKIAGRNSEGSPAKGTKNTIDWIAIG